MLSSIFVGNHILEPTCRYFADKSMHKVFLPQIILDILIITKHLRHSSKLFKTLTTFEEIKVSIRHVIYLDNLDNLDILEI